MRILHAIPGLTASSGPTQALRNLAGNQALAGHNVCIVHLTGRGADGVEFHTDGVDRFAFPVTGLRHWGYSPALRGWLSREVTRFDIVHMHSMWLYPNLAASRGCRRAGVPYIVRPAGSLEPWCLGSKRLKKTLYYRFVERRILEDAAALHAVSQQEADNIRRFGYEGRVEVIPNGVEIPEDADLPSREAARSRLGIPKGVPVVLFLSRIHPKKGLDVLGEAFRLVLQRVPDAVLAVAGPDGHAYADEVKGLYGTLGIESRVMWLGERTGTEKTAVYRACDLFVLPTRSENFGIVVAEALAAGRPAIVSRNAPWEVLEKARCGRWLELDTAAFADAIVGLVSAPDRAREMGENGRQLVRTDFSWPAITERVTGLYDELSSAQNRGNKAGT